MVAQGIFKFEISLSSAILLRKEWIFMMSFAAEEDA